MTLGASAQRHTECLNSGWEFRLNNEGEWRKINVPHDFQIEQPWVAPTADEKADNTDVAANIKSRLSSRGFKEMGKGYYRYHLTPDASWKGRRVLLDFEGIMYTADVLLNGQSVGGTNYGYVGFEIDLSDRLKYGEDNLIEVIADTREPGNSRWYTGGGLFRNVSLVTTPRDLYFEHFCRVHQPHQQGHARRPRDSRSRWTDGLLRYCRHQASSRYPSAGSPHCNRHRHPQSENLGSRYTLFIYCEGQAVARGRHGGRRDLRPVRYPHHRVRP